MMNDMPESLAIAGAWGYIGRKFLDAAVRRQIPTTVYDPASAPGDVALDRFARARDEGEFYRLPADLFHLATHPEHRHTGQRILLDRAQRETVSVLNEKPMALPESPDACAQIVAQTTAGSALMLYDFPELYDPLTHRILDRLRSYRDVRLTEFTVRRAKDREAPDKPRNYKRMVPIQYQESVHCLAFVLFVLGNVHGGVGAVLDDGIRIRATSDPYAPPNPDAYAHPVDGRCRFAVELGSVHIDGLTDFKRGAEFTKRRTLRGVGDGRPLCIEVDYLEGHKRLCFDGVEQTVDAREDSYESVLRTFVRLRRTVKRGELMSGVYPNPAFARITYQLSAALWRASHQREEVRLADEAALLGFDAAYTGDVWSQRRISAKA